MQVCSETQFRLVCLDCVAVASACGDIYQWEYINPADLSQGKRQSTTLCIGGAGVDAVPNAYLPDRDLSRAYLIGADLTDAWLYRASLFDADLSYSTLPASSLSEPGWKMRTLRRQWCEEHTLRKRSKRVASPRPNCIPRRVIKLGISVALLSDTTISQDGTSPAKTSFTLILMVQRWSVWTSARQTSTM